MRVSQLEDVLFPVEEYPVHVVVREESGERRLTARDKKAIVDITSHRVLGIVSRDYRCSPGRCHIHQPRLDSAASRSGHIYLLYLLRRDNLAVAPASAFGDPAPCVRSRAPCEFPIDLSLTK